MDVYNSFIKVCLFETDVEKIKNFYKINEKNIDLHKDNNYLFYKICLYEVDIEVIKYIYDKTNYDDWIFNINAVDDIFTEEDLICYLARKGYLNIAKYVYSKDKNKIDLYQKNNEPIVLACQENNLEFAKWLFSLDTAIDIYIDNIIVDYSTYYKQTTILKWYVDILCESNKSKDFIVEHIIYILEKMCSKNNIDIFINIYEKYTNFIMKNTKKNNINIDKLVKLSLYNKDKSIFMYLLDNFEFSQNICEFIYYESPIHCTVEILQKIDKKYNINLVNFKELFIIAITHNNIEICEYIYKTKLNSENQSLLHIFNLFDLSFNSILQFICNKSITIDTIKYVFNLINTNNITIDDNLKTEMIILLCKKNNLEVAQYVYDTLKNKTLNLDENIITTENFITTILYSINIDLVQWILEIFKLNKNELINSYINQNILSTIIYIFKDNKKKIKFLDWLFDENDITKFITTKTLIACIKTFNLDIIDYIYDKKPLQLNYKILKNIYTIGNVNILKWYLNKKPIYSNDILLKCFTTACIKGKYDIALYTYNKYKLELSKNVYIKIFKKSYLTNNCRIIFWLYSIKPDNIRLYLDYEWINLCRTGNYQLIRWTLNYSKNINVNIWQGFKEAIIYGNLQIVKLLYEYNSNLLYILSKNTELCLPICIIHGYNNILEWLNQNIKINIDFITNDIIYILCDKQYINTLNWLYENTKINIKEIIRSDNDYIFKDMCNLSNIVTIRFLIDKYDIYNYKIEDDIIIPIIKDTPEYYFENEEFDKLLDLYKIKNVKKYKENCSVCYNISQIKTQCNHYYCINCILKWYIYKSKSCPYCRSTIKLDMCNID